MSKRRVILVFIIPTVIFLTVLVTSIFGTESVPFWIRNLSTISSALIAYFLFLKDHSTKVYLYWHKFLGIFKRDTVSWSGTYKFSFIEDDYNFQYDVNNLIERVKASFEQDVAISMIDNDNENYATFKISYRGRTRNIKVSHNQKLDENIHRLNVNYEVSLSYSDTRTEIDRYRQFLNLLSTNHKDLGKEMIEDNSDRELHAIKMSFTENNPFYGLTVKHIDERAKKVKFLLSFDLNGIKITSTNYTLKAVSEDREQLINVLKEYIALSNIG